MASNQSKYLVVGSLSVAGLVALMAILDLFMLVPFAGATTMDVLFILASGIVGYLGWDAYRDLT